MSPAKSRLTAARNPPASLVSGSIDTLTQGVSQQPQHLRSVGQGEVQLNGWSSPVDGLCKRRPSRFVGKIVPVPVPDFYLETMPVTDDERYSVFLYPTGGKVRMQILRNGATCAVDVHGAGLSNVTTNGRTEVEGTAGSYIYAVSEFPESYVFINNGPFGTLLNRKKVTALSAATTPAAANEALLFIRGVTYEVTYTVTLNGTTLPVFTTPKASDSNNTISTDIVAQELLTRINAVAGFAATRLGSVIYVKKTDGSDFTVNLSDGRAGAFASSFKTVTPAFLNLPTVAANGFLLRIDGSPSSTRDDYWVKFVTRDGAAMGEGAWEEAPAPGIPYKLDENTMPLVVYRKAPDVFFVGPADGATRSMTVNGTVHSFTFPKWGERTAGSTE